MQGHDGAGEHHRDVLRGDGKGDQSAAQHHHNISTTSLYIMPHLFLAVVSTVLPMAAPATSTARQLTSPYTPTSCREVSSSPVETPGWCLVWSKNSAKMGNKFF